MTVYSGSVKSSHAHSYRVLQALRQDGPMTKRDIERRCQLSRPTVDKIIHSLCDQGLLQPGEYRASGTGRRPLTYAFNPLSKVSVGVDLAMPKLAVIITDLEGRPLWEHTLAHLDCENPDQTLNVVAEAVEKGFSALNIRKARVLGLGIGLPAFLNRQERTVTVLGHNLPSWENFTVATWLEQRLKISICVDNDVNFMALAESQNRQQPESVMLYFALRQGANHDMRMGSAILIEGQVFHGAFGNAASLQGMYVKLSQKGDLPKAITNALSEVRPNGNIVQALKKHLILPMVNMVLMLDPSLVVIHAQLFDQKRDAFIASCQQAIMQHVPKPMVDNLRVEGSVHTQCPGAHGAAAFVIQRAFNHPDQIIEQLSSR